MNAPAKHGTNVTEFDQKRVLATGGTKSPGKAIANRFQRGGATVMKEKNFVQKGHRGLERENNREIQISVAVSSRDEFTRRIRGRRRSRRECQTRSDPRRKVNRGRVRPSSNTRIAAYACLHTHRCDHVN